jgi:hypothetical protein
MLIYTFHDSEHPARVILASSKHQQVKVYLCVLQPTDLEYKLLNDFSLSPFGIFGYSNSGNFLMLEHIEFAAVGNTANPILDLEIIATILALY